MKAKRETCAVEREHVRGADKVKAGNVSQFWRRARARAGKRENVRGDVREGKAQGKRRAETGPEEKGARFQGRGREEGV